MNQLTLMSVSPRNTLFLPWLCAVLAAGCSLREWARSHRGSIGWSPSPPPCCLRRSHQARGCSGSRPASSGLWSSLSQGLNTQFTHKYAPDSVWRHVWRNLCSDNLTRWQHSKIYQSEQTSNAGLCYDLVEEHYIGCLEFFFFFISLCCVCVQA